MITPWELGEVEWLDPLTFEVNKTRDAHGREHDERGRYASAMAVINSWPDDPTDPDLKQMPFAFDPTETQRALGELDDAISNHDAFTRTTRDVPLANLRATQSSLVKEHLQHYLTQPVGADRPQVIVWDDNLYLLDGHHRAAVELARGSQTLRVEYIERKVVKDDHEDDPLWDLRDRVLERLARIAKQWEEAQHPRDAKGRFADSGDFWGDAVPYDFNTPLGNDWYTPDPISDHVNLYHVTELSSAQDIHREGFKPGKVVGPFQGWAPRELGTYGWASLARALYEVQRPENDEIRDDLAIVAVSVPKSHWKHLASDEDITQARGDWRASYKDGSAVYRGAVPREFISNIYVSHKQVEKAWAESQHPRDELGRFRSTLSVATLTDLHERFSAGVPLYRGVKPAGATPADPGDFGVGRYLTTSRSRAREYGAVQTQHVTLQNPLILTAEEAYTQLADRYGTISGVPGDPNAGMGSWVERLKGSQRATHDLQQLGYDGLVVVHAGRGELEVVEFQPPADIAKGGTGWDGYYTSPEGVPADDVWWAEVLGADDWDTWQVGEGLVAKWIRKWDAAAHPRYPKGHPLGGKFAPKGDFAAADSYEIRDSANIRNIFGSRAVLGEYVDGVLQTLGPGWRLGSYSDDDTDANTGASEDYAPRSQWGRPRVTLRFTGPPPVEGQPETYPQGGMVREFYRDPEGKLVAHHSYFELPQGDQGKGLAKDLLAFNDSWYEALGVDRIELHANLGVGGYAWARMGFKPKRPEALKYEIDERLKDLPVPAPIQRKLRQVLHNDPDFLYTIASARDGTTNLGKEILLGMEWDGELHLSDTKGRQRMEEAVLKRGNPYHKPAGSPEGGEFTTGPNDVGPVGSGFSQVRGVWVGPRGKRLTTAQQQLLKELGVPPAYTDVRFNTKPNPNRPKVWATDSKGRVKRFYSKDQHAARATTKYARVRAFEAQFPKLDAMMLRDLNGKGPDAEAAACLYLISRTALRPGSDRDTKAKVQAYGATTLEARHVKVEGSKVTLAFTGKNGKPVTVEVTDPRAKSMLKARAARGGRLFQLTGESQLRTYLKTHTGKDYKVKDLRTRYATAMAHALVKELPIPINKTTFKKARLDVAKQVAAHLGNAASMTLNNYIDPVVWKRIGGDKWS